MSSNNSLADWLSKLGITKQLNNNDILSGITVNTILSKTVQGYTIRLSTTNSASSRINNWNVLINELEKLNIQVNQQDKAKILNGDDKIVYNILYEIKQRYDKNRQEVQVDINKVDPRSDPKSAKSLLELFILVIIKYYGFSVKEAVALLSNDSKYLAHILAKGFKENPRPVEMMILELQRLLPQISSFCKNKQNETFFLKSLKPGLISKFLSISELSLQLLTMFTKNAPECYQIVKNELMPTLVLCLRRHGDQLRLIIKALTEIIGYNKNLLSLFVANGNSNEAALFMIQMVNQSQGEKLTNEVFEQFKMEQFVDACTQNIRNSQLFANSATFLIKLLQHNYAPIQDNSERLLRIVDNFTSLYLSKRGDIMVYTNLLFSFLNLLGKKKNATAPQLFKLAVDRYRNVLNEDQSHNYLYNFLQIIQVFPSIPTVGIAEAIIYRYENQTTYIGQLQLNIFLNSVNSIDEVLALKIYNIITKIFVWEVGSVQNISNILETIIRKFDTRMIFDLTVKFAKICLAVFYANLRKLNYSKSLIDGTIKLDRSNVFYKAKNNEIQRLMTNFILIRDEKLNKTLQPLICYSFFRSEGKNKDESQGIKRVMVMLGEEEQLRNLYENDARLMLQDVRNQGKKVSRQPENDRYKDKEAQSRARVTSDATLLIKKKNLLYNPLNQPKVSVDAQKGLERYTKVYLQKVGRHSLQQDRKNQQSQRKQQLRKLFTMKILQKGININKQITVGCIYDFNSREKQLMKDNPNDFSYLPFYDPQNEDERDVKALLFLMKKYGKLLKVYYNNYGGKLRPNTVKLFQDHSQRGNLMQTANVWRLLRDHFLDKYITVNEVQYLIQKINAQLKKQYKDSSVLDYQVFENFIIQASICMFSRLPKDLRSHPTSEMVQQAIKNFKEHAKQNRIDEKLFEQNEHFQSNKPEQIKELNQKLLQNPDYILPEGYKKQTVKKLNFDYKFHLLSLDETYKDVYEVFDQILSEKLGFHIIEAYSVTFTQATARPILYQTNFDYAMKGRSFSSLLPKESKTSQQQQAQQGIEEEQARETNVQSSKIENSYIKQRKQKEEERRQRQQEQQKRRAERDKQLKALLEKHRQKQEQAQRQKQEKKNEQAKRLQQEKRKREKYEQSLKKKVSEFADKKKLEKDKQQQASKKKKQQQRMSIQKLKQDVQRKKKLVQISKQKKKYDEQLKNQLQAQQAKKIQEDKNAKLSYQKQKTKKLLQQYKQKKLKHKQLDKSRLIQSQTQTSMVNSNESAIQSKLIPPKKEKVQNVAISKEMNIEQLDNSDS